jgi:gamma-glutamylcyclotransferase (GGCT)/AIG2-like uncharacterized protein YtfP
MTPRIVRADAAACGAILPAYLRQKMPLLFSYGTLQQPDVQRATFGRTLHGDADALPGFEPSLVKIEGQVLPTSVGGTHHANVVRTRGETRVNGTVFEVSDEELAAADAFEAPARYERIHVTLVSGKQAWVYVFAGGR